MKKALITGITGQDGTYLANLLLEKNYEVFGGIRRNSQDELHRLRVLKIHEKVTFINLDICDQFQVFEAIRNHQFDEIYNLACLLYTSPSPRDLYRSRMPSSA